MVLGHFLLVRVTSVLVLLLQEAVILTPLHSVTVTVADSIAFICLKPLESSLPIFDDKYACNISS